MASLLADAFDAPRLLVGAREAGAGSLIARFMSGRPADDTLLVLLESPADRYFEDRADQVQALAAGLSPEDLRDIARKAVKQHRPDRVIVGASVGFTIEKALIEAARQAGVPVISIVDHYWNLWQRFAGDTPTDRWRYQPDAIAVPDPWCRDRLQELGCPVDTVVTFEHPLLWASLAPADPALGPRVRERLGIAPDAVVVMFVSEYGFADSEGWQWDQAEEEDIYLAADELVAQVRSMSVDAERPMHVMIRPHPAESHDWGAFAARHEAGLVLQGHNLDKPELFAIADIAFGLNSMLLAEAGRAGVPSYSWFPDQSYQGLRLSRFASWVNECQNVQACGAAIRSVLGR
ncbi:hypothetical protein [Hoeflea alexandrii]|uniref:hypothetical protein n=1 Tax=Hoeflea alexandrii TaxID=288436 RepID=UPI0022AF089D|nr:hypothetical protein [Hoeflea alexandrii]MCZ4291916.1 hypothetical protein [Hoeflea alexandrii]